METQIDNVPVEDDLTAWSTPILRRASLDDTAFGSPGPYSDITNSQTASFPAPG